MATSDSFDTRDVASKLIKDDHLVREHRAFLRFVLGLPESKIVPLLEVYAVHRDILTLFYEALVAWNGPRSCPVIPDLQKALRKRGYGRAAELLLERPSARQGETKLAETIVEGVEKNVQVVQKDREDCTTVKNSVADITETQSTHSSFSSPAEYKTEVRLRKIILVIGETGAGKSSVVNLIVGSPVAETGGWDRRCPFLVVTYCCENLCIFDVTDEIFNETWDPACAPCDLMEIARRNYRYQQFSDKIENEGISLIICVIKKGQDNAGLKTYYHTFVEKLCKNSVPVLLVVTHCEDISNPENWYSSEQLNFRKHGMAFEDVVYGTAIDPSTAGLDPQLVAIYEEKTARTQQMIRDKIEKLALGVPWMPKRPKCCCRIT